MAIPEVSNNHQIVIDRGKDHLDRITVRVEIYNKFFHGELSELKKIKDPDPTCPAGGDYVHSPGGTAGAQWSPILYLLRKGRRKKWRT